jgi:hypothetical protein
MGTSREAALGHAEVTACYTECPQSELSARNSQERDHVTSQDTHACTEVNGRDLNVV